MHLPSVKQRTTVILFSVKVPVLSEQTTLTHPSVSTLGSRRTMAPALAMRDTLSASTMVTTAGSPSGTTATANDMAVRNISGRFRLWSTARRNNSAQSPRDARLRYVPSSASRF